MAEGQAGDSMWMSTGFAAAPVHTKEMEEQGNDQNQTSLAPVVLL